MTPEQEQEIRNLLKIPASTSSDAVRDIYNSAKDFLLATSTISATKPLTEASLSKLNNMAQTKPKVEQASAFTHDSSSSTSPPPVSSNPDATFTKSTSEDVVELETQPTSKLPPVQTNQFLQILNVVIPIAIVLVCFLSLGIGYNKFVVAPEAKRKAVEKQQQEIIYKKEEDDKFEAAKKAESDQIQASVAGNVDIQEQSRQRRYKALEQADPHGLPLVPHISDLRRKLSELDEKIKLLDGTSQSSIDSVINNLQNQIATDQAEADRLNANAGGSLYSAAAGRRSSYTQGYNEFHALLSKIQSTKLEIDELSRLKENPEGSLEQLKEKRKQVQLELGVN
ncbi:MAG: hypothetical protein K2X29_14805 [Candidatus Obscuribacterales bacterium]|nr:hypothetical protein [Candidatus Obscuribacterales bacterium]